VHELKPPVRTPTNPENLWLSPDPRTSAPVFPVPPSPAFNNIGILRGDNVPLRDNKGPLMESVFKEFDQSGLMYHYPEGSHIFQALTHVFTLDFTT